MFKMFIGTAKICIEKYFSNLKNYKVKNSFKRIAYSSKRM